MMKFDLTAEQTAQVKPLYDEALDWNYKAMNEGKEMAGAVVCGQLLWYKDHEVATAVFQVLDPEASAQVYEAIKAARERRRNERQA